MSTPANPPALITWLRAQLDDDEASEWPHRPSCAMLEHTLAGPLGGRPSCNCDAAHRWSVEVDAKRRILDLHEGDHECSTIRRGVDCEGATYEEIDNCTWVADEDCSTVKLLALPYADRPGYRKEWRP